MAILSARATAASLRTALAHKASWRKPLGRVGLSLTMAGVSWGLLVVPVLPLLEASAFAFVIVGVTIVGVSLICAMLGPLPRMMSALMFAFLATVLTGIFGFKGEPDWGVILATLAMTGGMVAFSLGSARHTHHVADTLVENRRLGEELTETLAHAEFLSKRDPLTGLSNRRAFFECDDTVTGHLLLVDLDHFKRINDTCGHGVGDRVLAATGDAFRAVLHSVPDKDHCAARLGGEEFAMLLPGVDEKAATGVAELLRLQIAAISHELDCEGLVVSASIGMASLGGGRTLAAALEHADMALYEAKSCGRNRVVTRAA